MINIFVFMYIEGNGMNFSLLCTTIFCVWFCNLYLNMRICEALSLTSLRARIFTSQEITLSWVDTLNLPDSRNLIRFPFLLKYTHFLSLLRIVFLNSNLSLNSVCFRSLSQIANQNRAWKTQLWLSEELYNSSHSSTFLFVSSLSSESCSLVLNLRSITPLDLYWCSVFFL